MKSWWFLNSNTGILWDFLVAVLKEKRWCWFTSTCRIKAWMHFSLVRATALFCVATTFLDSFSFALVFSWFFVDTICLDSLRKGQLDWERRFDIINGICRGLLYLHRDSRLRIIHRDLKPSNILLDRELNPKISDFGMARIFYGNEDQVNTTRVVGT